VRDNSSNGEEYLEATCASGNSPVHGAAVTVVCVEPH
jgi:hypothetical protein